METTAKSKEAETIETNTAPERTEDDIIKEITAPWGCVGYVPAIHAEGTQHPFQVTENELKELVRYWATKIKSVKDDWEYNQQSSSSGMREEPYAYYRLRKIAEILGQERVSQISEDVNYDRFTTYIYEISSEDDGLPAPETKVYYTTRYRSIVFQHSRAGLRPMTGAVEVPGEGWCWQEKGDFKTAKPVEHFGYASAEEALKAAQQAEDAFFKEVEREMQTSREWHRERNRQEAEATEELSKALAPHSANASYRRWSEDRELHKKLNKRDQDRLEVRLWDGTNEKTSARIFVDWLYSDNRGPRVSITVDATSQAWVRYEAVINALVHMQRRFSRIGEYWSSIGIAECVTMLNEAGAKNVTRREPQDGSANADSTTGVV